MSKPINLLSLVQAKANLSTVSFENFQNHHGFNFSSDEIDDLTYLVSILINRGCLISDLDKFFVGYKIPQIGKEFDLLRIGDNYIVNIELKRSGDEEKIEKQLTRNNHYLSFSGKNTYHYTYLSESGLLYKLLSSGEIESANIEELVTLLRKQDTSLEPNIDELFHPTNYLVSPFNSTEKFLAGEYFLTQQQEEVFDIMVNHLKTHTRSGFISLTGGAGTGKSLLTYHVAKIALKLGKRVLIIHCGILNQGHNLLISKGWNIKPIRMCENIRISDYDLVIMDESQRLRDNQFEKISQAVSASKALCIFSFDKHQTLATHEDKLNIESRVSALEPITSHTLSDKIRSNKEIADFISMLFNKNKIYELRGSKNIFLKYFSKNEDARAYLESIDRKEWQLLRFTPSRYNTEHHESYFKYDTPTSHKIIGQEFDNVVIVIDKLFSYHISGQLIYGAENYYNTRKMLFQNITRARKRLLILIIDNEEILERCIAILK
jgi:hypothetical protein